MDMDGQVRMHKPFHDGTFPSAAHDTRHAEAARKIGASPAFWYGFTISDATLDTDFKSLFF
jgi:hypothetical protein